MSPDPSFVGIGPINNDADTDARAMAKKLGITLPAAATGKLTRARIRRPASSDKAMAHFKKPGEVKDYVKRVTERAP